MNSRVLKLQILPLFSYPGVMLLGLFLQSTMLDSGLGLSVSSYIPIIIGVSFISALELIIPYRAEWKPKAEEVKADVLFTLLVQILLPKFLAFAVVISLVEPLQVSGLVFHDLWMHDWPVYGQVILMMVSAEFLRYWLHRSAHIWSPLWRLHAVHHSPDKLYWLNTGRFHPVEKAIQFLFDALPFILLGVSAEVLSVYFVFYAINGFFQHSNVNLRMGVLNYVISSAQLHRWHHSKDIQESGTNYGNNLIIWDIVFGSRFLPKQREVGELGLINRSYPMSFLNQLKTPFTPGVDKYQTALLGLKEIFSNFLTQAGIFIAWVIYRLPFECALTNPMKSQRRLLQRIIKENTNTEFGQQFGFNNIKSYLEFSKCISIQDYEDLRPFVEKQEQTKTPCLTKEQPHYYAVTSGTTGKPKYIPVVAETIKQHKRSLAIYACVQNNVKRHVFGGKILAISGAYQEGVLEQGSPYGSISGLLNNFMPRYLQSKYVVPAEVFALTDHELKYRLILRLALQYSNISYMVTANPSTFLKLIEILNNELELFANDLETGTFNRIGDLPQSLVEQLATKLISDPKRAEELRKIKLLGRDITYSDIWPNLKLVVTWVGGSCGVAITRLKKLLSIDTRILELGYLASELRGTITLEDTGAAGVLTFQDNFYEFIEVDKYESGDRNPITLNKLNVGKLYFIIITTPAGLFRYFMNDIIEVTGYCKKTPLIRFIQKGKGVTNITGEKLSEQQLMVAIEAINMKFKIDIPFYIALTSIHSNCYKLYVEQKVDLEQYALALDDELQELNTEYASKRSSGRLNQIIVVEVKAGTGEAYKEQSVVNGVRDSQFKYLLLQNETDCHFPFEDYIV